MLNKTTGVLVALCASGLLQAQPQTAPVSPAVRLAPALFRGLIVETVYPLKVSKYVETTRIELRTQSGSTATPEDTLIEMISSMKARDFAWNSKLWTPASRQDMAAHDAAQGRTPGDWTRAWPKYPTLSFWFVTRIEYGKYVLIQYEAKQADGTTALKDTMAFEKVGNSWLLTQALAADPVLLHWDEPTGRVQIAPDSLFRR
jgi:hypothetical protein